MTLTESFPDKPRFLTNPALICYYLFYPGHDEGLRPRDRGASRRRRAAGGRSEQSGSVAQQGQCHDRRPPLRLDGRS
jgi:hypothetical protein